MKAIKECVEEDGVKKIFLRKEKGKTFLLQSNEIFNCQIIAIDSCVFEKINLRRSDYLFLISAKSKANVRFKSSMAFYIELKGDDVKSACEQLYNAIDKTKSEILNYEIQAKVIGTKGFQPNIKNNEFYRKVKRLIKKEIDFHKVHRGNGYQYNEVI